MNKILLTALGFFLSLSSCLAQYEVYKSKDGAKILEDMAMIPG